MSRRRSSAFAVGSVLGFLAYVGMGQLDTRATGLAGLLLAVGVPFVAGLLDSRPFSAGRLMATGIVLAAVYGVLVVAFYDDPDARRWDLGKLLGPSILVALQAGTFGLGHVLHRRPG